MKSILKQRDYLNYSQVHYLMIRPMFLLTHIETAVLHIFS